MMKVLSIITAAAALLSVTTGCAILTPNYKRASSPTVDQVAGIWCGYTSDELAFYRLELNKDGTGWCASVHLPNTCLYKYGTHQYRIQKWELDQRRISFVLTPDTTSSEPIYIKGVASSSLLRLEVGGTSNKWSRNLVMRPEKNFAIPNRDTKEAIIKAQQGGPGYPPQGVGSPDP